MIYLNNAATSFPKPDCVRDAIARSLSEIPDGQSRGSGSSPGGVFGACRESLAALFNIPSPDRVFFSSGSTESLNLIIRGMEQEPDSRVLATVTEHNSVLRPLFEVFSESRIDLVPCDANGIVSPDDVRSRVTDRTVAFFLNHCSNVTGAVQDIAAMRAALGRPEILLVVDASQSAGEIPVDVSGWGIDALAFTGHKGLLGAQGSGGLYIRDGVRCRPLKSGGTGVDSRKLVLSESDFSYEAGTQNAPGIAALNAAVGYISGLGVDTVYRDVGARIRTLYEGLRSCRGVSVYGDPANVPWGPVLSFNVEGLLPTDVGFILEEIYGIRVRAGLHCAPLIHGAIGTAQHGTVRVSPSVFTHDYEIDSFLAAIGDIAAGNAGSQK